MTPLRLAEVVASYIHAAAVHHTRMRDKLSRLRCRQLKNISTDPGFDAVDEGVQVTGEGKAPASSE
jgi:hypothetical protein